MNAKITATLMLIAAIGGLVRPVHAQSQAAPNSNIGNYTVSGNSLTGINHRTAQNDFTRFFPQNNLANISSRNVGSDIVPYTGVVQIGDQVELQRSIDEPLAGPNSTLFPEADQSFNANDGVQVQIRGK